MIIEVWAQTLSVAEMEQWEGWCEKEHIESNYCYKLALDLAEQLVLVYTYDLRATGAAWKRSALPTVYAYKEAPPIILPWRVPTLSRGRAVKGVAKVNR